MENEANSSLSWILPTLMAGLAILISLLALWRSSKGDRQRRQRDTSRTMSDCILVMQKEELILASMNRKLKDVLAIPGQEEGGRLQRSLETIKFMINKLQEIRAIYNDALKLKSSDHDAILLLDSLLVRLHQDWHEARDLDKLIDILILEVSKKADTNSES